MVLLLAAILLVGGAVWLAQGLNLPFAPDSFMTADPLWVAIGGLTALAGILLVARWLRR